MKTFGIIVAVLLALVALVVIGLFSRGCVTASKMADQTVFNADKHVWSYEEFHRKYEQYQQYTAQEETATKELEKLEAKGITSGQRYDNLVMEKDGVRNMKARIAADYNAMSKICYQGIWKSKGLPEKLQ